jgi:polyphosphate kinase 1
MENKYNYFKRDISWLSFNYRVLLEADDERLPIYERINFISIYSSNLEEFYKVRVADQKAIASGIARSDEETTQSAIELIDEITVIVNEQLETRVRIYEHGILPTLRKHNIIFYQGKSEVETFHQQFIREFFREEIFPYLQPVPVTKNEVISFLRDDRLYLAARVLKKNTPVDSPDYIHYFVMKVPYSKVPRFIELPKHEDNYYLMFIEDIIKANLDVIFPGFDIDCSYCVKISRDADILVDNIPGVDIVEHLKKKVKKRKIGAVSRFVYDRHMPDDFLSFLVDAFQINLHELVPGDKHLNLEDLKDLPNPNKAIDWCEKPLPMKLQYLNKRESIFSYVKKKDLLIHYPYHSFDHFTHFLKEAAQDSKTREIMLTQYRVAQNSEVINELIAAAGNGKKVTVFVELKARFDEENNLATAEMMKKAGINIIYSLPGLKVHAKVALVIRESKYSFAYISTGNFNEKTALVYADVGLFTANAEIVQDVRNLFLTLQGKENLSFKHLLVTHFNLIPTLNQLIDREIKLAKSGKEGYIIIKLNGIQDPVMINKLYEASENGVKIDLIIRGICCVIPGQPYSQNIKITRIVDSFLEHTRIMYFGNDGNPKVFFGSPDWMKRNLYRRIEAVTPIRDNDLRQEIIDMLQIQLNDNEKACFVDARLRNLFKKNPEKPAVRAQYTFYEYLSNKNTQQN